MFFADAGKRLCLDNGFSGTCFHDDTGRSVVLLRPPKPEYGTLDDMAQYDELRRGHYSGKFERLYR
jgi:hypothetical protein